MRKFNVEGNVLTKQVRFEVGQRVWIEWGNEIKEAKITQVIEQQGKKLIQYRLKFCGMFWCGVRDIDTASEFWNRLVKE